MPPTDAIPRRKFHRASFLLAGIYNIAWGIWAGLDPQWLFRFSGMEPLNHPQIFSCVGMIVGMYGFAYLEVARRPERSWVIAAVGLGGKILGPIGMANLIVRGEWPLASGVMCLTNDLMWWPSFALYLHDAWPNYRRDWYRGGE